MDCSALLLRQSPGFSLEVTSAVRFRMLALGECNAITNRLCGETGLTFAGAVQGRVRRFPEADGASKKAPLARAGPWIWAGTVTDDTEPLALAAVSAATVASTAAVSTAGMSTIHMSAARVSATVRTAEACMRRDSVRPTAAVAAETAGARRD
jgi:hypothetical protein